MKIITVFKVKINYKSGHSEIFECTSFKVEGKNLKWSSFGGKHRQKPLDLVFSSVDDIESVWQLSYRKTIQWSKD